MRPVSPLRDTSIGLGVVVSGPLIGMRARSFPQTVWSFNLTVDRCGSCSVACDAIGYSNVESRREFSHPVLKEVLMLKTVVAGLTALFVTASSLAYAQAPSTAGSEQEDSRLSAADLNALTDARIAIVKAALQLTPEQAKYWPALEEAIRNRAMGRQVRLAALSRQRDQGDSDLVDVVRRRADALAQRSAELKQLADAWQPLSATLTPEQKQRLRFFAANILRLVPRAIDLRRMQNEDEGDED